MFSMLVLVMMSGNLWVCFLDILVKLLFRLFCCLTEVQT